MLILLLIITILIELSDPLDTARRRRRRRRKRKRARKLHIGPRSYQSGARSFISKRSSEKERSNVTEKKE